MNNFVLDRSNDAAREYGLAVQEIAKELKLSSIDAWSALSGDSQERQHNFHDGVHYTASGNNALFEAVKDRIEESFPEWLPEIIPMEDPFNDITSTNMSK